MPEHGPHDGSDLTRRGFLAAGGAAALASLAGCSAVADWIVDQVLGDVNVVNETDEPVGGTITVADPDGDVVLEEAFDLAASEEEENADAQDTYEDVWEAAGAYEVSVELDEGDEVRGESSADGSVEVGDPDEDKLVVILGSDELEEAIAFEVVGDVEDLEEESE